MSDSALQTNSMYIHEHRVAFYETDAMGVIHHSNHIRLFEEARVSWLRAQGLLGLHTPQGPLTFAVLDVQCRYLKTALFDDLLQVYVEGRLEGLRLQFQYAIFNTRSREWIATGRTDLVTLGKDLQLVRLPPEIRALFESVDWRAEWPPATS